MYTKFVTENKIEKNRNQRPIIRPISQIILSLTDREAYLAAIQESVAWLAPRAQAKLPPSAFSGQPFDLSDIATANPTEAVSFDDGKAKYWGARLSFPDASVPQRNWVTEISIMQGNPITLFSARLTNITRGEDAPFSLSVPGVIFQILSKLSAEIDGEAISNEIKEVINENELSSFIDILENPNRQIPIIAMAVDAAGQGIIPENMLVKRLGGACHIYKISEYASKKFTNEWGRQWSVFNKALRIYSPKLSRDDDNYRRHKLFLPQNNTEWEKALDSLAFEILPRTFEVRHEFSNLSRFESLRARFLSEQRKTRQLVGEIASSQIQALENEALRLQQRIEEDDAAARELLWDAAKAREVAEYERNEARSEVARLRVRISLIEDALNSGTRITDEMLSDYNNFEEWCAKHLAGHIVVIPKAIRETRKHGNVNMVHKILNTLLMLRDYYVPMRRKVDGYDRATFDSKCKELGVEESACFATTGNIKNFPEYSISYGSQKRWMDRHIKYGHGYDLNSMFRIYFCWDDEEQILFIGNMPTHLDNRLTN